MTSSYCTRSSIRNEWLHNTYQCSYMQVLMYAWGTWQLPLFRSCCSKAQLHNIKIKWEFKRQLCTWKKSQVKVQKHPHSTGIHASEHTSPSLATLRMIINDFLCHSTSFYKALIQSYQTQTNLTLSLHPWERALMIHFTKQYLIRSRLHKSS